MFRSFLFFYYFFPHIVPTICKVDTNKKYSGKKKEIHFLLLFFLSDKNVTTNRNRMTTSRALHLSATIDMHALLAIVDAVGSLGNQLKFTISKNRLSNEECFDRLNQYRIRSWKERWVNICSGMYFCIFEFVLFCQLRIMNNELLHPACLAMKRYLKAFFYFVYDSLEMYM